MVQTLGSTETSRSHANDEDIDVARDKSQPLKPTTNSLLNRVRHHSRDNARVQLTYQPWWGMDRVSVKKKVGLKLTKEQQMDAVV